MKPLIFGPASRQLFGLYHEPEREGEIAVLVCAPFGQEALRTHRLFRVLADRLAQAGVAVLRFDYYGTGDSPGEDSEGELEGWRRDVGAAHAELRGRVGGRRILWLGARLGATVAVMAARSGRCDPSRLILWDPIIDGARYLDELRARHVDALEVSFCVPDRAWRRRLEKESNSYTDSVLGFGLSPELPKQLKGLTSRSLQLTALHDTVILARDDDQDAVQWARTEAERQIPARLSPFQHPLIWTSDPFVDSAMVPIEVVQRLQEEIHA
ncbi:alpha/beta fold hydrolase [Variovorax ureilyticus]|uniref:alpha/beta fold hydrolase n=1 Tax=Variovorax ureilyticus TaxID=1836198 RepID=UPI003D67BE5E